VTYLGERRHFYDTLLEIDGNNQIVRMLPTIQIHLLRRQFMPSRTRQERDPVKSERIMKQRNRRILRAVGTLPRGPFSPQ